MPRLKHEFQTVRSEGGLLPIDLLRRVVDARSKLPGTAPEQFGLAPGERLNEAITHSWNRLRRYWTEFRSAARNLPDGEAGTGLTNEKWNTPLLRELGFGLLPAGRSAVIGDKTWPINRFFGSTAIHLIGCKSNLDRRTAAGRGSGSNPHGLVQEFLNRSNEHLWAIVSNGLRLRILRDSQALSRQSFLEFDLEAMFAGEVYSDFVLLWMTAHATRFAPQTDNQPESCWLEQWTKIADEDGTRALGALKAGVEKALQILGEAFVSHPRNTSLRESLRRQELSLVDFHGQLLRIVYRLIFLFVAEDRTLDGNSLLHPPDESDAAQLARERYATHYSTARLRTLAGQIKGTRHGDLWQQFNLLVGALAGDERFSVLRSSLALPVLGSFLWSPASTRSLNATVLDTVAGVELGNADFLEALRHLAFTRQGKVLRPVDYKNLGAEELGGVYESLLALTPQISGDGARFTFAEFAGNERKTSGSYYTPDSLVQCLLDSALDPVVAEALKGKSGEDAEKAILGLKVCDPAVGSGHFLVGAAHRLARHLSRVRANSQGESEPSPLLYQHALRDVIGRCLYGVDINPMSAELCRVSLWLEALEPGKPLSFLDHHIQVGNSLLGTTPALLAAGIPDDAFTPIEGDVKSRCTELKRDNKRERQEHRAGQGYLFDSPYKLGNLAAEVAQIDATGDGTPEAIQEKERRYAEFVKGSGYQFGRLLADTWCAAFVWKKDDTELGKLCPTERDFRKVESHAAAGLLPHVRVEVERLRDQYQFFHWHLAFPDVFRLPGTDEPPENERAGWSGGFDVVLGNPPWERVKLQEKEWFSERKPEIANASNAAARKQLILSLKDNESALYNQFFIDSRRAEGESHLIRNGNRYPLCGRGDINLYAIFAELFTAIINLSGRSGTILPCGIATDDTTKHFFQFVVENRRLHALIGFINEEMLFPSVLHNFKFAIVILGGQSSQSDAASVVFNCFNVEQSKDIARGFSLTSKDIALLNPNTRTCPVFFWRRSAEITAAIYRRIPILRHESGDSPWALKFGTMFHMSNDSELFTSHPASNAKVVPLYEAKMFDQYNHRYTSYEHLAAGKRSHMLPQSDVVRLLDPFYSPRPCYYVQERHVSEAIPEKWSRRWLLGYREITSAGLWRTTIYTVLPRYGASNKIPLVFFEDSCVAHAASYLGCMNSFVLDFVSRQKLGGASYSFFIKYQLPVVAPSSLATAALWNFFSNVNQWVLPRVMELIYTAWDIEPFARDYGYDGPPFRWNEERRFFLRAELDAAFFHLYLRSDVRGDWVPASKADGCPHDESPEDLARLKASFPTPRDAVSFIMDTFPIVRRKDEEKYNGDYRTKRVILEIYDAMQGAIRSGQPYRTRLDPPPGPPTDIDGHFIPLTKWQSDEWPTHIHLLRSADSHR